MNDHSGAFPHNRGVPAFQGPSNLPSTGLRDVVVAVPTGDKPNHFHPAEIWRVIAKWWWLIAAVIVACEVAAVIASLMIQPQYAAQSTLEVNMEGVRVVDEKMGGIDGGQRNEREFLNTQAELLRSRAIAERVARSLNVANNAALFDLNTDRAAREAQAAAMVQGSVTVEAVRDSRLIEITAVSPDPALAAAIANAYGTSFIQANLERRFEATSYARNFLEQRINTVRQRLENSERQL
ncbi:MAG TPA: Wzz/FepE/Etk N-terminal domain-containing protein, partial [Allosphingosinicella sp.]|nr:Wzz/FepE/Etk N-terminal domain-containing protein [Allosphingosinicella sp.]